MLWLVFFLCFFCFVFVLPLFFLSDSLSSRLKVPAIVDESSIVNFSSNLSLRAAESLCLRAGFHRALGKFMSQKRFTHRSKRRCKTTVLCANQIWFAFWLYLLKIELETRYILLCNWESVDQTSPGSNMVAPSRGDKPWFNPWPFFPPNVGGHLT